MLAVAASAYAQQKIPTLDTGDGELGSMSVGGDEVHPFFSLDVRNGDYSRGSYDNDASDLRQIPIHGEVGLDFDLHRNSDGAADAFFVVESSNGFHAPRAVETSAPRFWYESNNLLGFAVSPTQDFTTALTYTNKRSPNGVAGISHELSLSFAYQTDSGLGRVHPTLVLTAVPTAGRGAYMQLGIEPQWKLGRSSSAPRLSVPLHFGLGLGGFYQAGTGTVTYGNVGLALSKPLSVAGKRLTFRSEILALVRGHALRQLDGDNADHAAVVPLATIGVSTAF